MRVLCLVLLLGLPLWASGEPITPNFRLNKATGQVRVADQQKVVLQYDVRAVNGQGIILYCWGPKELARVWRFDRPFDERPLKMQDLPLAVYRLQAVAIDAQGNPVAQPSPVTAMEYGGWRAWKNSQPDIKADPPVFSDAGKVLPEHLQNRPEILIMPPANMCGYGKSIVLTAAVKNLPADEQVTWELDGEGTLKQVNGAQAVFTAPEDAHQSLSVVRARSRRYPEVQASSTVLITEIKEGATPDDPYRQ